MVVPRSMRWTEVSHSAVGALSALSLVVFTIPMWVQEAWAQQDTRPSAPSSSSSADEAAIAAFQRGTTAFGAGRFVDAAVAFEEAFALAPHAAAQFNAAKAWANANAEERAADLFMRALERDELGEANAVDAQARLEQLRQKLGWVELVGDSGISVSVGSLKRAGLPAVTHLAPGKHQIVCFAGEDEPFVREVIVSAGVGAHVSLAPNPEPPGAGAMPDQSQPPAGPPPSSMEPIPEDDRKRTGSPRRTTGFALLGVGGVVAGTAVGFGVATLRANDEYRDSGYTDAEARGKVVVRKLTTNALAISAVAVGGAGVVLLATKQARRSSQVGVRLEPDRVALEWAF